MNNKNTTCCNLPIFLQAKQKTKNLIPNRTKKKENRKQPRENFISTEEEKRGTGAGEKSRKNFMLYSGLVVFVVTNEKTH